MQTLPLSHARPLPSSMPRKRRMLRGVVCAAFVLAPLVAAHAADAVSVNFVDPAHFVDAGGYGIDRERTLTRLDDYLKSLGRKYLAAGETLKIDVLDVELAGHSKPSFRTGQDIRVLRGGADWPSIELRYTLQAADGRVVDQRQERISDMNYLADTAAFGGNEPLHYEKLMLDRWFKSRFAPERAAER